MKLDDLLDLDLLDAHVRDGFVRVQSHPTLPLRILNYTEKTAYDGVWDGVTLLCRGLIFDSSTREVVARPFPKFFNYGQNGAPDLDLEAPAVVTDKLDGSLGILYPTVCERCGGSGEEPFDDDASQNRFLDVTCDECDGRPVYAIATRGSFTSEQALHATEVWKRLYAEQADRWVRPGLTYLFEIIYPENRIVVDYEGLDNLVLLAALEISSGRPSWRPEWPGPRVQEFPYRTLADALRAETRPNCEGLVVYLPDAGVRVKIKQEDYVALHRILTGTNARNVWEVVAVQTCASLIRDPKHWGSYLGVDSGRAEQVLELGDEWLAGVPDEFYSWVDATIAEANETAMRNYVTACHLADDAREIADRKMRYEHVSGSVFAKEVMRLASAEDAEAVSDALGSLLLRCWREACPEPTAPFARSEAVA